MSNKPERKPKAGDVVRERKPGDVVRAKDGEPGGHFRIVQRVGDMWLATGPYRHYAYLLADEDISDE